jgi:hypothetical protein
MAGDRLVTKILFLISLTLVGQDAASKPATPYALTLVAIGPGQICVSKNTDDNFLTAISHLDK